jgi:ATP-dependent helicase HrpA
MLQPHLFMNFKVVDEHGRQLGMGRHLATLKAELGGQARSAFQALAALKLASTVTGPAAAAPAGAAAASNPPNATLQRPAKPGSAAAPGPAAGANAAAAAVSYTAWTFGELPELMEIRQGAQTMVGFPALIDKGTFVLIEVFDEPATAAAKHRAGLRRLVALAIKEPLKYLEKNIPDLTRMATSYMVLGTVDELRQQIIDVALDRAFLAEPLPASEAAFKARVDEGRARLNLIAQEVARLAGLVLVDFAAANRKLKDAKPPKDVTEDVAAQLARLVPKRFLATTPWPALQHFPRYLKAVVLRLDKLRADPARDAARLAELRPLEQRFTRRLAEQKGVADARLEEYRWLLEELRVSFFAQELRTPQPVSMKRLDKAWQQLSS